MTAISARGREIGPQDRAHWLAERRQGLGASEAAAAIGLSPFETPLQLYLRKVGLLPEPEETEAMRWGTLLEPLIAEEYQRRTGARLERRQVFLRSKTTEAPIFATLDAIRDDGVPVEFKTCSAWSRSKLGEEGTDELPEHWLVQAHVQMIAAEQERVDFAVLVGGQEFRLFRVEFQAGLGMILIAELTEFWRRIERREPPPPESAADVRVMHALYPDVTGADLVLDAEAVAIAEAYEAAGAEIKRLSESRDRLKADLLARLGSAPGGLLPDGRRITRKVVSVAEQTITRKAYAFTDLRFTKAKGKT